MKKLCIAGWLALSSLGSYAQISNLKPQLSPQSPNVAALGRFGEHPVSLYTGVPSISVPIYDIAAGAVRVPVSLNYHAGGHRVTDVASWVGLGWALNAGGVITRTVIGRPDERDGVLNRPFNSNLETNNIQGNGLSNVNECTEKQIELDGYTNRLYDTGYDIFNFSLPGKSGKFILIPDGTGSQVTTMPFERLKITYEKNVFIEKFTVVDEDGITYTFSESEQLSFDPNLGYYTSSWYLTTIQGNRPDDVVRFYYDRPSNYSGATDFLDQITVIDQVSGNCSNSPGSGYTETRTQVDMDLSSLMLREIIFPGGRLEFIREGGSRNDLPGGRALDRIKLYGVNVNSNSYQLIKQYDLQQNYFSGGAGSLRLYAVAVQDANNPANTVGQYQFDYNSNQAMPGVSSRSRDIWGYFNGKTNSTLIPPQTIDLYGIAGYSGQTTIGSADRSSSEEHTQAWILNKVAYPTGGFSRFFYEINRYNDNGTKYGGGLRIARIETRASEGESIKVKTYKYGPGEDGNGVLNVNLSTAFWSSRVVEKVAPNCDQRTVVFGSNSSASLVPFDGSPVTYSEVTEYEGTYNENTLQYNTNGKTVHTFQTGNDELFTVGNDKSKTYTASYHWERGQLLTKTVYNKDGGQLLKQVNTYANPIKTRIEKTGVLIAAPQRYSSGWYSYNNSPGVNACELLRYNYNAPVRYYYWPKGNLRLTKTETYSYGSGGQVLTILETAYNSDFQPNQQTTSASDGTSVIRQIRYPSDFSLPSNPTGFARGLQLLKGRHQLNPVIEEYSYKKSSGGDSNPVLTGGKITTYQEFSSAFGYAFPKEVYSLEVLNGCCRKNSYSEASVSSGSFQKSSQYALELTYKEYDYWGNPLEYVMKDGLNTRLSWQIITGPINGPTTIPLLVLQSETANFGTSNSLTTQYEYDVPLVGVKTIKDPSDRATRFEYDAFSRLRYIRDNNQNLVKSFDYNYKDGQHNPRSLTQPSIEPPPSSGLSYSNGGNLQNVSSSAVNVTFTVNSTNVNWNLSWPTSIISSVSPSTGGNGNTPITVSFQANTNSASRNGTITLSGNGVANRTIDFTQLGFNAPPSSDCANRVAGLNYKFYHVGSLSQLPDFTSLTPVQTGAVADFDIVSPRGGRNDQFAFQFEGYLNVPQTGSYRFTISSDDGSKLYIDGVQQIDYNGLHGMGEMSSNFISLTAGCHSIRVDMFENDGGDGLLVSWEGPGFGQQVIPSSRLLRDQSSSSGPACTQPAALVTESSLTLTDQLQAVASFSGGLNESGASYQWVRPDGSISNGQTYSFGSFTAAPKGTYQFKATIGSVAACVKIILTNDGSILISE